VDALLRTPPGCVLIAINAAEVVDVLVRYRARDPEEVAERLDWLAAGGLDTIPVDDHMARQAGILRARHYHRSRCPVSISDCVALAAAMVLSRPVATSDPAMADVASREGIGLVPLQDASGMRPTGADRP
jgi:PIN domain nuclease of toxin-antitoxin system